MADTAKEIVKSNGFSDGIMSIQCSFKWIVM